jgi:hypothetical protein
MVLDIAKFLLVLDMYRTFVAGFRQLINLRTVTGDPLAMFGKLGREE